MSWIRDILLVVCFGLSLFLFFRRPETVVRTEFLTDTVLIRDTVRVPPGEPEKVYVTRIEEVPVYLPGDTVKIYVPVPIERKVYRTEDYHAVIEGFRPELVEMTLFPQTRIVTNTEIRTVTRKKNFGLGLHAGYGFNGAKFQPYIGVGVHYNIMSW